MHFGIKDGAIMVSFGVHLELWNQFTTFVMPQSIILPQFTSHQFFEA